MFIEKVYIQGFRNLDDQEVCLCKEINLITGDTGQGKSSFLETLSLLVFGASFRTHYLREAIAFSRSSFFVEACVNDSHVRKFLGLGYDGLKRHVLINKKTVSSTKELLGLLLGVSASLSDVELITGAPVIRRRYLDEQIAEINPLFVDHLMRAGRALLQRNVLLRAASYSTLDVWDEMLARSASFVISERRKTCKELIPHVFCWIEQFPALASLRKDLEIRFKTQLPEDVDDPVFWLQNELKTRQEKERAYKRTLVGHHVDDLIFLYRGLPLKQVLSLGQLRLMVLAVRLSEWSLLRDRALGRLPVFLLDDIDGTLDKETQRQIFHILLSLGQVIVTSHDDRPYIANRLKIVNGIVESLV